MINYTVIDIDNQGYLVFLFLPLYLLLFRYILGILENSVAYF